MNRRAFLKSGLMLTAFASGFPLSACTTKSFNDKATADIGAITDKNVADNGIDNVPFKKIIKTDAEWKRLLTKEQ